MDGFEEFLVIPIDDAKRERLRRDPRVTYQRNDNPVPYVPTLRAEGVESIRKLLNRNERDSVAFKP